MSRKQAPGWVRGFPAGRLLTMSGGPTDPEPDVPTSAQEPELSVKGGSVAETAQDVFRLKKAGVLGGPIVKGSVVDAALKSGVLGQGGSAFVAKLDIKGIVAEAQKSQERIATITDSMREPFVLPEIPRVPSPELVAMHGIREAVAALGDLLKEQASQTALLAQLQADSGRVQAAANGVMSGLTGALVVFTSVLVFEPAHGELVGLVIGLAISAVLLRGTIRTYATRARGRLRRQP